MQDAGALDEATDASAKVYWRTLTREAVATARALAATGVHKHWANRLIEFCSWHTCVVSSTEWSNYDALRDHEAAAPEIRTVTRMMKEARAASKPWEMNTKAKMGWHMPYVVNLDGTIPYELAAAAACEVAATELADGDVSVIDVLRKVSVGRCAAVSYNRQETTELDKAVSIYQRLKSSGHMSPFEHVARPMTPYEYDDLFAQPWVEWNEGAQSWVRLGSLHYCGNFQGWVQERKMIRGESDFARVQT
jgi:hypothetical protein